MWTPALFFTCVVVLVRGQEDPCGGNQPQVLSGLNGAFTSPNHPTYYENNLDCTWRVDGTNSSAETIRIDFTELLTEQCCDYIDIHNGYNLSNPIIATYSGFQPPLPPATYTTGPYLTARFTSDADVNYPGFRIKYNADPACRNVNGSSKVDSSGSFSSPYHPDNYGANESCSWTFTGSTGATVTLNFQSFVLEPAQPSGCVYDYVEIIDGSSTQTYCHTNSPGTVTSTTNQVVVRFVSDGSSEYAGFQATYAIDSILTTEATVTAPPATTQAAEVTTQATVVTTEATATCDVCYGLGEQCCDVSDLGIVSCCPSNGTFTMCCPDAGLDSWGCCDPAAADTCVDQRPNECADANPFNRYTRL